MEFDIDVSGQDLLSKDYTICVANQDGIIKGYKFSSEVVKIIHSKFGQGIYTKYSKSKKGMITLKVRLYSIMIYYIFKSLKLKEEIELNICRDFSGHEQDVKSNLNYFLKDKLKIKIKKIRFGKLKDSSNAHQYAYLMRKDNKNKLDTYIDIKLKNIEKFLKK